MKDLVIYHSDADGWVAALQAYLILGDEAHYRPMQYGDPYPNDLMDYKRVYVVDFSLFPVTDNMVIMDHHKTAAEKLANYSGPADIIYDVNHAGCYLAHKYFNTPAGWLIDYVEDHDLWKFILPDSKAVRAGLLVESLENFDHWLRLKFGDVLATGRIILRYTDKMVAELSRKMLPCTLAGYTGLLINNGQWISELGNYVIMKNLELAFIASWFVVEGNKVVVSLRGPKSREIAQHYGGGGHDTAAGFQISLSDWVKEMVE